MNNHEILVFEGEELFGKQLRKAFPLTLPLLHREKNRLPSLNRLMEIMQPKGEADRGRQEIRVEKIIGSEDRSDDFIGDFLPKKRWMMNRWRSVMVYMRENDAIEPIRVIEYGGYYFVRDGNHRVSVAKALNLDYLSALVTYYRTPLNLPTHFDCATVVLFREMVELHNRTKLFEHSDESLYDVRRPGTWTAIGKEIFESNRAWFVRKNGREPDSPEELIRGWEANLYRIALSHIRENSLHYLLPRWGSTDIFTDFVKFWNSFPDPDQYWLEEIYKLYSARLHRRRFFLTATQSVSKMTKSFLETKETALARFKQATRQEEFIPQFALPSCSKQLVRYLYRQVYFQYALYLKKKFKRAPYIQELAIHWYDSYYSPLIAHYNSTQCRRDFTAYYIRFSRKYFRKYREEPERLKDFIAAYCENCAYNRPGVPGERS